MLEITEGSLVTDAARGLGVLARLRLKGFGLSIDDFGTGYSSLAQLSQIPFTELKIDQEFVSGASHEPRKRAVIEASLDLAHKLQLDVVAEGVETTEDWQMLAELGCGGAQVGRAVVIGANGIRPFERRLRHRLFLARAAVAYPGHRIEDRPGIRLRREPRTAQARGHRGQPGSCAQAATGRGGRGRGDHRGLADAGGTGLRRGAGFPDRAAGVRGGIARRGRALAPPGPLTRPRATAPAPPPDATAVAAAVLGPAGGRGHGAGAGRIHAVPRPAIAGIAAGRIDRKSTRLTPVPNAHLVCRLLLEK